MTFLKIAIGADHGGLELKKELLSYLKKQPWEVIDFGIQDVSDPEQCHYPLIARKVGMAIQSGECEKGILVCGTGIGISIAANKINGIRAAHACSEYDAKYARLHNDANVLCLGGRTVGIGLAREMVDVFLMTPFSGEERHVKRIGMIRDLEEKIPLK